MIPDALSARQPRPQRIHPADWGLDPQQIRYGEFGLLLESAGPRLVVYDLEADWVPPREPVGSPRSVTPAARDGRFVVSRLHRGNRNALGGYFNVFTRSPASGLASLAPAPDGVRALLVDCTVSGDGYCGAWMHLFDFRLAPPDRKFVDARSFRAITFQVWTDRSDDQVMLKVADASWEAREDAPPAGLLHEFVGSGHLGPVWQRVTVPIDRLHGSVDRSALASIILQSVAAGRTRVWVRDVTLVVDPGAVTDSADVDPAASPTTSLGAHRAVWVWNTDALLDDPVDAGRTITFLADQGVDVVFLQVPDGPAARRAPGERVLDVKRLRPLIAGLSRAGIHAYALDGAARFATPPYHDGVVRTVEHVIAYNSVVDRDERFFGVRYDIEPYLLPGFHGPGRDRILRDFLTVVERIASTAHDGGLAVGLDIPFWYDEPNERTFATVDVEWHGVTRPASHHLIDLVDNVSVMAYRTAGYGADGTITHSDGEVRYAAERGKQVFVGLETLPLPDEVLLHVWGAPRQGLPAGPDDTDRILLLPEGDSVLVVLSEAGTDPHALEPLATAAVDPSALLWWPVRRRVDVPASKLTFAGMTPERLRSVQEETAFELSRYPSFAGFALHHVVSWRELVAGQR